MLNQIKSLYARLEVIDLNVLVDLDTSAFQALSTHLKQRDQHLKIIGECLAALTEESLSEGEQDEVLALQDGAERRNRLILATVEELHRDARDEWVKWRSNAPRTNPYARTARPSGRVRA